jgi:hypothetical protein
MGTIEGDCTLLYGRGDLTYYDDCETCLNPSYFLCKRSVTDRPAVVFVFTSQPDFIGGENLEFSVNDQLVGVFSLRGLLNPTGPENFMLIGLDPSVVVSSFDINPAPDGYARFDYATLRHGLNTFTFKGPLSWDYDSFDVVGRVEIFMAKYSDGVISDLGLSFRDSIEPIPTYSDILEEVSGNVLVVDNISSCGYLQPPTGTAGVFDSQCLNFGAGVNYSYTPYTYLGSILPHIPPGGIVDKGYFAFRLNLPLCTSSSPDPGEVFDIDFYPEVSSDSVSKNFFLYVSGSTTFGVNGRYKIELDSNGVSYGVWGNVNNPRYALIASDSLTEIVDYSSETVLYSLTNELNIDTNAANLGKYDNEFGEGFVKVGVNINEP